MVAQDWRTRNGVEDETGRTDTRIGNAIGRRRRSGKKSPRKVIMMVMRSRSRIMSWERQTQGWIGQKSGKRSQKTVIWKSWSRL